MKYFLIICCFSFFLLACKTSKHIVWEDEVSKLIVDKRYAHKEAYFSFRIDTAFVHGNYFTAMLSYEGGCVKPTFQLITKGDLTKSIPPLTSFHLHATRQTETCTKPVKHKIVVDLSPFKQRYDKILRITLTNYPYELIYNPSPN